ncbi:MAG: STT3 domain-containing protein [Candidatus Micrarchaeaceae archaeon]
MKINKYYDNSQQSNTSTAQEKPDPAEHDSGREHAVGSSTGLGKKLDLLENNKYLIIGIALLIIAVNIVLRAGLLQYQGLFEPDGFFYYSVIRAEINAHYSLVNYLGISGFPSHNFIGEAPGLPYLTVIGYYLLHGITGLSALTIMRWMPILFGVLYAILAYFLVQHVSKSRSFGLLAMLFVSLSSGNIARTAGTVYRGDSFIALPLMVALLLMLMSIEDKRNLRKCIYAALAAVSLSIGAIMWNGSPFIVVIYMLSLLLVVAYGFIKADKSLLFSGLVLTVAFALTNILERLYRFVGLARPGLEFVGNSFIIFYVPLLVVSIATYYLVKHMHRFKHVSTTPNRIIVSLVSAVVVFILIYALFGSTVQNLAAPLSPTPVGAATNATKQAIGATTQELQPPTYNFLWSSFNIQLFLAPLGIALFILFAYLISINWRFIKRDHFQLNAVGFLVIIAYLLITAYLQASAIRFNAIVSIPLAIFAAFAVYGLGKLVYHYGIRRKDVGIAVAGILIVLAAALIYNLHGGLSSTFKMVSVSIALMFAVLAALVIYSIYSLVKGRIRLKYIVIGIIAVALIYNYYITYFESYTASQADGINPQFLEAMTWLKNNTATNATVLALWPDGSVVEGWGNRTSYMDSVGGENGTRILPFSQFLFNTSIDSQYLYGIGKPEYLVARNFWYEELGGIAQEGLVQNASAYGYVLMDRLNSSNNATAQFFTFSANQYPYYRSELIIVPEPNGTSQYTAYLGLQSSSNAAKMRSIIFLNTSNDAYSIDNFSANDTINYTLMVSFSGHEINGAYVLGPKLVASNLFKFTFLCNYDTCPYNDSNVSMQAVYINGDTKIYKINYLG